MSKNHDIIALAPSPFELFAADRRMDITPAVLPDSTRVYADLQTQTAFEFWNGGAQSIARILTESTLETLALREKIRDWRGGNEPTFSIGGGLF